MSRETGRTGGGIGSSDGDIGSSGGQLGLRRRAVMGALAAGTGLAALGATSTAAQQGGTPGDEGDTESDGIHPIFGFSARSADVDPPVEPDHEVALHADEREQADVPFPEWHFEPVGLAVEPGDTVRFQLESHLHTVTAYHPEMGFTQRVPDGVGPITSPPLWTGSYFLYTFEEPGVYDLLCLPHEFAGMVMRVVAGEATGPGAEPVPEPQFAEAEPNQENPIPPDGLAATVLRDPALAPETVLEQGSVSWEGLAAESKQFPAELLMPPTGGESLVAVLAGRRDDVETDASGCAHFTPTNGSLAWDIVLEDIEGVTQAHVHEGARGEDGPIVAPMLGYTAEVDGSGEGDPRDAAPDAPIIDAGTIDDAELVEAIVEEPSAYYVNVHTVENPGGEIRGQIRGRATVEEDTTVEGDDETVTVEDGTDGNETVTVEDGNETVTVENGTDGNDTVVVEDGTDGNDTVVVENGSDG